METLNQTYKDIELPIGVTILTGDPSSCEELAYYLSTIKYAGQYEFYDSLGRFYSEDIDLEVGNISVLEIGRIGLESDNMLRPHDYRWAAVKMIDISKASNTRVLIVSNDYLLLKNLYVEAHHTDIEVNVIDVEDLKDGGHFTQCNIKDGISYNSVIQESIDVYRRELEILD